MEIARLQCVHAMPPITKDRDRPRSASDRERSRLSTQCSNREGSRPSDEDLMNIRSRPRSTVIKSRWKSNSSDVSTCHQVSPLIAFTYVSFPARVHLMIAWTRVHAISAVLTASKACRASTSPAKGEKRVGHSPTRKEKQRNSRLNCGAQ